MIILCLNHMILAPLVEDLKGMVGWSLLSSMLAQAHLNLLHMRSVCLDIALH